MPLSTSDFNRWRRFSLTLLITCMGAIFLLWLFIIFVDPWGMLPLSPPFKRIPISTNARYSFPALAIDKKFNSIIIGTSTSRPLQPQWLDTQFKTKFVNLSMNSATPWEQERIFNLFLQTHPTPKVVIFNMDQAWCFGDPEKPNRPFPLWMYGSSRWKGYLTMANLYALQEAFNQFLWLVGLKKQRYGSDGFTPLLPANFVYSPQKVNKVFQEWDQPDNRFVGDELLEQPALNRLYRMLNKLPKETVKIIIIPPFSAEFYGKKKGLTATNWKLFKENLARLMSKTPKGYLIDFAIINQITTNRYNFWDPIHYRPFVADQIMQSIVQAVLQKKPMPNHFNQILSLPKS
ncbi:hypothetical protein COMNV_01312 [Commensalibacter sp. Nvir]|uniref:hypothetical protein n=1 Tax=Commensalibacter sp. Nvir TaxID=3069817 RepID=UPI002D6A1743|nr:hypothetical protein COMNV_01312 [Commensalibacter sp. Nvir]